MKIIHCADIHLDSRMRAGLTEVKARKRRAEMLRTFERMVDFADEEGVRAILISGDLFDTENVSAIASDVVYNAVKSHPDILFFLLGGNHDRIKSSKSGIQSNHRKARSFASFLALYDKIPENLIMFSDEWESYEISPLSKIRFKDSLQDEDFFIGNPLDDENFTDELWDEEAFEDKPQGGKILADELWGEEAFEDEPRGGKILADDLWGEEAFEDKPQGGKIFSDELWDEEAFADEPSNEDYFMDELLNKDDYINSYKGVRVKIFGKCIDGRGIIDERDIEKLNPDIGDLNIVMLHGLASEYSSNGGIDISKEGAEAISSTSSAKGSLAGNDIIDLRLLRYKSIDYLALGHIHSYRLENLDDRGMVCYPGCLEARGFDECGEHGFVLLDIDEKTGNFTTEFINSGGRNIHSVEVDITSAETTSEICEEIRFAASHAGCSEDSIVRVLLTGSPLEVDIHRIENIKMMLEQDYFHIDVVDKTSPAADYEKLYNEKSLRGEFIRAAMSKFDLSEDEKNEIIKLGISILSGERI